jgi:tetratricopeptide (TPR) repeat protein
MPVLPFASIHNKRSRAVALLASLMLAGLLTCFAQAHPSTAGEKLGTVNFSTSCDVATQPDFNRAVALMHSFQFARAIETFHSVLAADKTCAIAYWGIALSNWGNPFATGQKAAGQLKQGLSAVEQARSAKPKTEREAGYIEAVAALFTDTEHRDQRARVLTYESAMSSLSARYPGDMEASIFYALAMAAAADPSDKTYARQLKAGKILDALYVKYPDHPGLAHYIIHAYDVPPLAARAAAAAQHYGEIAPFTPHALHMPSHTFTRVGDWRASIKANLASAAAARKIAQPVDELHADDYLVYAYLQTADEDAAAGVVNSAAEVFSQFHPEVLLNGAGSPMTAYLAHAAIPARYALERRSWTEAATLKPLASPFPQTEAITYFARGLGAARQNDADAARSAVQSLETCRNRLDSMHESYWSNQVKIQQQVLTAWIAHTDGKPSDALAAMRIAAEWEDQTEKSAATPGPLAPAREQLGDLLLELKHPAEAQKEFESTLTREPNRFWALYGAAEAARQTGNHDLANKYFEQLIGVVQPGGHPERREIQEARAEIAKR